MNRSIKWRVRFKTLKERDTVVYVYEEGYIGEIIDLEGAENPFSTEEDSSEELLSPIRSSTGYLRVINDGHNLEGLMPHDNMQHYIELLIDGNLEWCGYMQAANYTQEWDAPPVEVEYPLLSGIASLDGVYLDQNKPFGDISISALLKECFEMNGITYDKVYFPAESRKTKSGVYTAVFDMVCSRFNFFSETSADFDDIDYEKYDAWKAIDVVAEICKFLGWSLYEYKKSLYFVSHGGVSEYRYIEYSSFGVDNVCNVYLNRKEYNMADLPFDGDAHTQDILQGFNKFKISANFNPVGDVVPVIDEEALGRKGIMNIPYRTKEGYEARYEQLKAFGGGGPSMNTEMIQYAYTTEKGFHKVPFDHTVFYDRIGACYAESDMYEREELVDKKNYDYKSSVIISTRDMSRRIIGDGQRYNYPVLKMRNARSARYKSGAFVISISASRLAMRLWALDMLESVQAFDVHVSMRCGHLYWDGKTWNKAVSYFVLRIDDKGKIVSNKTLDMPYNGADGYIIPIKQTLSGDVELTVYAFESAAFDTDTDRVYIEGLKVVYYGDDNEVDDKSPKANKYQATVEGVYKNDMEIDLNIASYNKNMAGYGLLSLDNDYVKELWYDDEAAMMRPERHLLSKLKRIYGRNIEKLTLEIERAETSPFDMYVFEGKHYAIAYRKTEWKDEHQEMTLMDV